MGDVPEDGDFYKIPCNNRDNFVVIKEKLRSLRFSYHSRGDYFTKYSLRYKL